MNRKILAIIIILMTVSLLGIISVQFLWIQNAISIEKKKFDTQVFRTLNNVSGQLEQEETLHRFKDELVKVEKDSNKTVSEFSSFFIENLDTDRHKIVISTTKQTSQNGKKDIEKDTQIIFTKPGKIIQRISPTNTIKDSNQSFNIEINTQDTVRILHKEKAIKNVMNKVIWEYKFQDKKIEDRVDLKHLSSLITNNLKENNIPTEFQFGIVDKTDNKIVLASNKEDTDPILQSPYQVRLFQDDIFAKYDYLSIYFPNKNNLVYKSLVPLLLLSVIFTLFILGTFLLTLLFILRQKKVNEVKSDFINNITHEFKTPIATIGLAADSIVNPKIIGTPDRIRYFTSLIKDENFRMNKQVENILQLSLLDKRELELNPQAVHLNEILQKASDHILLRINERQGQLTCKWEALNDMVRVDEVHFINVLFNLMDNAIKYSTNAPEIEMGSKNEGKNISIWIQDKGIGMSKKTLSKIFEKFYRAETGNLHSVKGFGLGLNYVKLVVERHDGSIKVSSKLGEGTRVEIELPLMF